MKNMLVYINQNNVHECTFIRYSVSNGSGMWGHIGFVKNNVFKSIKKNKNNNKNEIKRKRNVLVW